MTCIAGYAYGDGVVVGADDRWSTDYVGRGLSIDKVYVLQDAYVIGVSGTVRAANLIEHEFRPPPRIEKDKDIHKFMVTDFIVALRACYMAGGSATFENGTEKGPAQLLVGVRGRLFQVGMDYQVAEFRGGYDAIGSGAEVALGAFAAMADVEAAGEIDVEWLTPYRRVEVALGAAAEHARGVGRSACIVDLDGKDNVRRHTDFY